MKIDTKYLHLSFYRGNRVASQSSLLLTSTVGEMICLIVINYFLTRQLGTEKYGIYSLLINIFTFSKVIFNFGFFQSAGRIVATTKDDVKCRHIYAAAIAICFVLDLLMNISIIIFLCLFNEYRYLLPILLITIPFNWIYLMQEFMELVLQGKNKIKLLSLSRLGPRILFLIWIIVNIFFISSLTVKTNIEALLLSYVCVFLFNIIMLKPIFAHVRENIGIIMEANRQFGFNIYIGSVFAVGVASFTGVLISYFVSDPSNVGFYNLSLQLATPLTLIPNILATVLFTRFVDDKEIDSKYEVLVIVLCIILALSLFLLSKPIVSLLYGDEFLTAADLLNYLVVGSLFYGIANFYNRFLLAKGKGRELRNASFVVGVVLLVSNILFLKHFGVVGAAYSYILAGIANCVCVLYYYRKLIMPC